MEDTQGIAQVPGDATEEQIQELGTLDTTLAFQLLLIAALLLSFVATLRQREALCCEIAGETEKAAELADVFSLRCNGTALSIGAAIYFLWLALQSEGKLNLGSSFAVHHSAELSVLEAVLVLAATLVRMTNLVETERSGGEGVTNLSEEEPA